MKEVMHVNKQTKIIITEWHEVNYTIEFVRFDDRLETQELGARWGKENSNLLLSTSSPFLSLFNYMASVRIVILWFQRSLDQISRTENFLDLQYHWYCPPPSPHPSTLSFFLVHIDPLHLQVWQQTLLEWRLHADLWSAGPWRLYRFMQAMFACRVCLSGLRSSKSPPFVCGRWYGECYVSTHIPRHN